jgi:oxygen-dependent protoporphyrinogen oxidase
MEACRELGLADALQSPASSETRVFTRGALRPLPARLMQGAPGQSVAMLRSGVLSLRGFLRAGLDFVLPRTKLREQASIGELVEARIGREAAERLVDPLLGGVHASSIWQLDAQLLAPQVVSALGGRHRSLLRNMRAASAASGAASSGGSPFRTIRGGLQRMIDAMAAAAREDGVKIRTGAVVKRVHADGRVQLVDGEAIHADAVIIAVPSYAAAAMLCDAPASCVDAMRDIDWASTVTCLVRVPTAQTDRLLAGVSGVLVPRIEQEQIKAITCVSTKWAHEHADDTQLLKCYMGYAGDQPTVTSCSDEELLARTRSALQRIAGITDGVELVHIERFERAIPQYTPGHAGRVETIHREVAQAYAGRVQLTGASWHGSGMGSCIAHATDIGLAAGQQAASIQTSATSTTRA